MSLEEQLHQAMLDLYKMAGKETGYWGNYYLRSVRKNGGLATARRMLVPKKNQKIDKGLQALIDAGRALDLSVESIALRPEFRTLFSEAEVAEARNRLSGLPNVEMKIDVPPESNFPETLQDSHTYAEGSVQRVLVNVYERDSKARAACIERYGLSCEICGINFEKVYGEMGKGFIHVHHKKPLAIIRSEYRVDPKKDLVPVCPNCHAMLHTTSPPLPVEYLKQVYESKNESRNCS
jgi:5-methylcytosine-specific restriction protein A